MDISLEDALSRLSTWRDENASLEVHFAGRGLLRDEWMSIRDIRGAVVELESEDTKLVLDFADAVLDWDDEAPASSNFDEALHARFPNGDRCLLSRLRASRSA
jgi:hypothetical protein